MKDDLISRQAAIDTIMGQPPEPHYPSWYATQIEKLPTAEERKGGTWKEFHGNKNMCICQSCGFMVNKSLLYDYTEKDPLVFKYCPSCGSYNGGAKRR